MKIITGTMPVALTVAIALMVATTPAAAQTSAEAACRAAIAKSVAKYTKTVGKVIQKCHKDRNKNKVPAVTNCNDLLEADTKDKLDKARTKTSAAIDTKCVGATSVLVAYSRCPSPAGASDDAGATDGIDDLPELSQCLIDLTDALTANAFSEAMGSPAAALTNKDHQKCQKELGKGLEKMMKTVIKERSKCQKGKDKQSGGLTYTCGNDDTKGKIAKTSTKVKDKISKRCSIISDPDTFTAGNETLDSFGTCGDTVANLQTCIVDRMAIGVGGGLTGMSYTMPANCQAGVMVRNIISGTDPTGQLTRTFLSTGWSGSAQGVDVVGSTKETLRVVCDDDCGACTVRYKPAPVQGESAFCRCENDSRAPCEVVNGPDATNCGGVNNNCNCYFGGPLALASGSNPVCVLNRVRQQYSGSVDLGTGEWLDQDVPLNSGVFLGTDNFAPCPLCTGDAEANDNLRGGTCQAGLAQGSTCDVNAVHPTFGPSSFDCPPDSVSNISGGGLILNLPLNSATVQMDYTLPCDAPGEFCPCRVCSGNASVGCNSDADCAAESAGTCTGGGGAGVARNSCDDGVCGANGRCTNGPDKKFCDGVTRANGNGFLGCSADVECAQQNAGTCTLVEKLRCFTDPIITEGIQSRDNPTLGAPFCIPATSSVAINETAGLPGPGAVLLDYDVDIRCAGDNSIVWQPPAGANCPLFTPTTTTSTTLLPPLLCGDSVSPICNGECPQGTGCVDNVGTCECQVVTPCAATDFPTCGGFCPVGQICAGDVVGQACGCM